MKLSEEDSGRALLGAAAAVILAATGGMTWISFRILSGAVRNCEERAIRAAAHFIRLEINGQFSRLLTRLEIADSGRMYLQERLTT